MRERRSPSGPFQPMPAVTVTLPVIPSGESAIVASQALVGARVGQVIQGFPDSFLTNLGLFVMGVHPVADNLVDVAIGNSQASSSGTTTHTLPCLIYEP